MLYVLFDWLRNPLSEYKLYSIFQILDQIEFRALAAAALSFLIMLVFGRRVIAMLVKLKIGDAGLSDAEALQRHASSRKNVPTMGGVLIAGAIAASVLLLADVRQFYVQVGLIILLFFGALGAADDWLKLTASRRSSTSRQGLYAWEKLVFQLGVSALIGWALYRHGLPAPDAATVVAAADGTAATAADSLAHVLNRPMQRTWIRGEGISPHLFYLGMPLYVLLATLMVTGMSNAVNIADGMDGLAGGVTGIVTVGLATLALIAGNSEWAQTLLVPYVPFSNELAVLCGAMMGSCFGFLWWNCSPASVFMGDTGALSLGAIIGYVATVVRQEFVVLVMCGIFLIEAGSVALQVGYFKSTGGKRIFKVAPYHHHLHLSGWTEQQIVVRFWIISVVLVVLAIATIKAR
jgi:phospho-N-acetylmuramoyl-pentapeptide-transferase